MALTPIVLRLLARFDSTLLRRLRDCAPTGETSKKTMAIHSGHDQSAERRPPNASRSAQPRMRIPDKAVSSVGDRHGEFGASGKRPAHYIGR
jgi:hypothetical protein